MKKCPLVIKAGFLPYADGSGFAVDVAITVDESGGEEIHITTTGGIEVGLWPGLREGIERLLKALP